MSKEIFLNKFKEKSIIDKGTYGPIYKAYDSNLKINIAIKEIDKIKYKEINNINFNDTKIFKINPNKIFYNEIIETEKKYYIIMDLYSYNLKDYLNKKNPLSINEIREILFELNEILKITEKENIILRDLKLSNILISLVTKDEIKIKLCKLNSNEIIDKSKSKINNDKGICLTIAPEILKGDFISKKSDIWSLGIIIYYMLFKEYPFNGKTENEILKDINSNKNLKITQNKDLNDLINRMLIIDENQRITWDNYFNHIFFNYNDSKEKLIQEYNQIKIRNENNNIVMDEKKKILDVKLLK